MYRKSMLAIAALLAGLMLALSACSEGESANTVTEQPSNAAGQDDNAGTPDEPAGTKTVDTVMGPVEIPADPQRIVVNGLEDILLTLDVPIVQAQSMEGHYLYQTLQEKNVPVEYTPGTLNFESIIQADPDLIVAHILPSDKETYDKLSSIAPTLVYDRGDWRTSIAGIGDALGRSEKAAEVVRNYDAKLQAAKTKISEKVGDANTVTYIRPASQSEMGVFFPDYAFTRMVYHDLGLTPDESVLKLMEQEEDGAWGAMISMEKLPELTADILFVSIGGSFDLETDMQKNIQFFGELKKSPIWNAIPAVKNGQLYEMSARHWMLNGPIADSMKIDDVLAAFGVQ